MNRVNHCEVKYVAAEFDAEYNVGFFHNARISPKTSYVSVAPCGVVLDASIMICVKIVVVSFNNAT